MNAYSKFLAATEPGKPEDWAAIQKAVLRLLRDYYKEKLKHFPEDVALHLAQAMKAVCDGEKSPLFTHYPKHKPICGRRAAVTDERQCFKEGAKYLLFCRAGLITDHHGNKTLCDWFGVTSSTPRLWAKTFEGEIVIPKELSADEEKKLKNETKWYGDQRQRLSHRRKPKGQN